METRSDRNESESDSERDKEAEEEVRRFSVCEMYEQVLKVTKSAKASEAHKPTIVSLDFGLLYRLYRVLL